MLFPTVLGFFNFQPFLRSKVKRQGHKDQKAKKKKKFDHNNFRTRARIWNKIEVQPWLTFWETWAKIKIKRCIKLAITWLCPYLCQNWGTDAQYPSLDLINFWGGSGQRSKAPKVLLGLAFEPKSGYRCLIPLSRPD